MIDQQQLQDTVNDYINALPYPARPRNLYEPIRYTLESGGKRLRPTLLLSVVQALGGDTAKALRQAAGIEMFHNFTLLHDDVMDNADVRRGRPTVHVRYGQDSAILSGDAMLTMATQMMADCDISLMPRVLGLFNRTAMEIYQGQQYDMDFEDRDDVTVDEYIEMIRLKTSVLLGCACMTGAILAGADDDTCRAFYSYGEQLGLAFQLQDDCLDTYGDPLVFGKQIGGDILNDKKTWLRITACREDRSGVMERVRQEHLTGQDKIDAIRALYDSLDLENRIAALVSDYADRAVHALDNVQLSHGSRQFFSQLAQKLNTRVN